MAEIAVNPTYMKDVVLSVDGDTYEKAVSSVTFTPSVSTATFKGLDPEATFTEAGAASWTVDLEYAQDWDSEDSLSAFLFNNAGSEVALTFKPKAATSGTWSASVMIIPGAVGGAVDSFAVTTVSLPVQGQPSYTPPA